MTDPDDCALPPPPVCDTLSERDVLEILYAALGGDAWNMSTHWLALNQICAWYGIGCRAGHVNAIQLTNNNLVGTIPEEIACLTHLQYLELGENSISGLIPPAISNLIGLKILHLDNNLLQGSLPSFDAWTHLQFAYFDHNCLCGVIPGMSNMTALKEIHFDHNQLDGPFPVDVLDLLPSSPYNPNTNFLFEIRNGCNFVVEPYPGFWVELEVRLLEFMNDSPIGCPTCSLPIVV